MQEIHDEKRIESILRQESEHFQKRPQSVHLLQYEKGELLTQPLMPLRQFLLIVSGTVQIFGMDETSRTYSITLSKEGTLLGDVEFCKDEFSPFFTEATETVLCLAIPFDSNRTMLERDHVFLKFVMAQMADKLSMMAKIELAVQTLEEKVLLYLNEIWPSHQITSVNAAMVSLHCSRRQLQRVLKKLCDEGVLEKYGRGSYRLNQGGKCLTPGPIS